jgi:transposase
MDIVRPSRQRRHHPEAFKQSVIDACRQPGVSVAGIALANGINANQVRRWMRERGIEPPSRRSPAVVSASGMGTTPAFVPVQVEPVSRQIRIEVQRGNATVKVEWPIEAASECSAWLRDWLR